MTSISALSSSQYQYPSPLDRLQNELTSEVSAGTISSSDQDALSGALNDIDTSLKSGGAASGTPGSPPAPGQVQSKIDDLISSEVQSGKLTSDQADELKGVFAKAFSGASGGAHGAHHGHHAHGGGGPPPSSDTSDTDDTNTDPLIAALTGTSSTDGTNSTGSSTDPLLAALNGTSSSSSSSSGSSSDPAQLFNDFIQSLQQSLSQSGYGANGQSASISAAFVVNFQS